MTAPYIIPTTAAQKTTRSLLSEVRAAAVEPAMAAAKAVELPSGKSIRMVLAPYFLATKLEAFDGRGKGDYLSSHDIEDIVAVLDGRPEILDETQRASKPLQSYLAHRFSALFKTREFLEALAGHLPGDAASQGRIPLIKERMEAIDEEALYAGGAI